MASSIAPDALFTAAQQSEIREIGKSILYGTTHNTTLFNDDEVLQIRSIMLSLMPRVEDFPITHTAEVEQVLPDAVNGLNYSGIVTEFTELEAVAANSEMSPQLSSEDIERLQELMCQVKALEKAVKATDAAEDGGNLELSDEDRARLREIQELLARFANPNEPIRMVSAETPMIDFEGSPAYMKRKRIAQNWDGIALSSGEPIMFAVGALTESWLGVFGNGENMQGLFLGYWDTPEATGNQLSDADAAVSMLAHEPQYAEMVRIGTNSNDPQCRWYLNKYGPHGAKRNSLVFVNGDGFLAVNTDGSIYTSQPIQQATDIPVA